MKLRDLDYLIALAEFGHFGKAAVSCHVTQPTLSAQIKKLEERLNLQLVERQPGHVMLTEAGNAIADRARLVVKETNEIWRIARQYQDPEAGEIRLGVFPTLCPYLLPRIMPGLTENFPRLTPFLIEEKTDLLVEKLLAGDIDCAVLALPVNQSHFESLFLFEEPFQLLVSEQSDFADRKRISLPELQGKKLLLLEEGHCLRDQALEVCQLTGMSELDSFRATSLETLRQMVAANVGMTLMPELSLSQSFMPSNGQVTIPFEAPVPSRKLALFWRKNSAVDALCRKLAMYLVPEQFKHSFVQAASVLRT
ncbi:MAG: LysR substrate-binding domain-containing protein [bacterium]